jgi:hypothetical protein
MLAAAHAAAAPPVVSDGLAPAIAEDTVGRITLPYRDADGDRATSCSVSSMTLTVERDCACDETGECAVEMRGLPDAHGEASFEYDVSAGGETSPRATIRLEVRPVDDPPVAITATHPPLPRDTQVVLELPYRDPDGPAQACSVSALVNVEQVGPCRCTEGRCTAAIRGLPGYEGTASLQFTISEAGRVSPPATASLAVGADAVALRIPRARDYLGFSVAAHGRRFVVGAPGEATSEPRVGSAYVLASGGPAAGAGRRLEGQLRAPEGRAGDYFGAVVAMSEGVIAVLQDGESWFPPRPNKLHLFVDPGGVGRWQRRNVIERPPGARRFGGGVGTGPGFASLAVDGARIAVGAYQAERSAGARELDGAVYVYDDPTADLDWADAVQTRLVASVPQRGAGLRTGAARAQRADRGRVLRLDARAGRREARRQRHRRLRSRRGPRVRAGGKPVGRTERSAAIRGRVCPRRVRLGRSRARGRRALRGEPVRERRRGQAQRLPGSECRWRLVGRGRNECRARRDGGRARG